MTARAAPVGVVAARARVGVAWALPAVLWLGAALISGFTVRRFLEPFDEGVLLQAATRMADGQWPWRDFGWPYGPGQPLLVAGAFKAFGTSVLWWRLLRVAVDATTALLVWALVRDRAGPRWAAAAWAAAAVTAAQPTSANPTPAALAFTLGAVLLASRGRPAWAGAAAAAAAFWRPDFGLAAMVAAMATAFSVARAPRTAGRWGLVGMRDGGRTPSLWDGPSDETPAGGSKRREPPSPAGAPDEMHEGHAKRRMPRSAEGAPDETGVVGSERRMPARRAGDYDETSVGSRVMRIAAGAVGLAALLYAPFVAAAGVPRAWESLVVQATRDGAWWRLPFPDSFDGTVSLHPADLKHLLIWTLPYVALAGLAAALVPLARRRDRAPAAPGLAVLALAALAYLLSRADAEHAQPLLLTACALVPLAASQARNAAVAATLGAALALILAGGAANRLSALLRPPHLVPLHLAGASGVEVPPAEAQALPPLAELVQRLVPGRQPIYVAPRRSDLVTSTDPLLYVLLRRPNVLHRDALLQAKPVEQRRIVAALRRARPRVVIRWTDPRSSHPEPNLRGRPTGSRALDAYLEATFRLRARFGAYDVLVPR